MAGFIGRFFTPDVGNRLLIDEGEFVVDEVYHHWSINIVPVGACFLACVFFLTAPVVQPILSPVLLVAGLALAGWGLGKFHQNHMDRFVITNMRVFRVHGVFSQTVATMPMTRILDITVHQPFLGRIFNYGHLVFESAAQDQGLRDVRYVARPQQRDLTIQRVIQRAGLRKTFERAESQSDGT